MSEPFYTDDLVTLWHGDCLDVLATLPDESVHAVVTDPPYGLANTDPGHVAETIVRWVNGERDYLPGGAGFMGKAWDAFVPPPAVWDECLRVLKPGGHLLAFAGSRTIDLMTLGVRLAGFEIRDSISWLYGSGFPKSLDVSKAIDKAAGAEREVVGIDQRYVGMSDRAKRALGSVVHDSTGGTGFSGDPSQITAPATPDAARWSGWGTALKPAHEPIVVARKPLGGTVAANVLTHGTGAINVDGCRVAMTPDDAAINAKHAGMDVAGYERAAGDSLNLSTNPIPLRAAHAHDAGRWPTNVVLDESAAAELDRQSGVSAPKAERVGKRGGTAWHGQAGIGSPDGDGRWPADEGGGASRFFPTFRYEPKAPTAERPRIGDGKGSVANQRCAGCGTSRISGQRCTCDEPQWETPTVVAHPTVKPLDLMRWLVRLVTPPGGTVLEPFAGSGTTAEACVIEGFSCIAIEREADYLPLIVQRLSKPIEPVLNLGEWTA